MFYLIRLISLCLNEFMQNDLTIGAFNGIAALPVYTNGRLNGVPHEPLEEDADGRQLQRVGVQPHLKTAPTPQGLAAGRDAVLEAAVQFLNTSLKK